MISPIKKVGPDNYGVRTISRQVDFKSDRLTPSTLKRDFIRKLPLTATIQYISFILAITRFPTN